MIKKILIILFCLLLIPATAIGSSTKLEDSRRSQDKVNVKATGNDYGLLTIEGITTQQIRIEYDASDNPIYIGWAQPGANYTDAKWLIVKLTWSGENLTRMQFADGVSTYIKVWNNRTTYDYEPDN